MDWARAIERNSEALVGIVEALFAMLGLVGVATVARIPQPLHRAVLRVLRPAESALRRLIVIAARGIVVKPAPSLPMPAGPIGQGGHSRPSFQLFDPRKSFASLRLGATTRIAPAHPYLRTRSPGGGPVAGAPSRRRSRLRRPMVSSMPNASPAGSRPSSSRSMICRARPGVSPAGG